MKLFFVFLILAVMIGMYLPKKRSALQIGLLILLCLLSGIGYYFLNQI
jgi:hypothetical protein